MAPFEIEITISSAKDLKNVNWRHGDLKPYVVVWVDPIAKCTTRVDDRNDTYPSWDEKLIIPLHDQTFHNSTLFIDVVHANARDDTKPLVGSTRVSLTDVVEEVGLGRKWSTWLNLKRPSGRPHGKLEAKVELRDLSYNPPPPPVTYAPPYGQQAYGQRYAAAAPAPPSGYPYGQAAYGQAAYGAPAQDKKKGGRFGVGTGLAVGAAAGLLGGLAVAGGVDYVENKIADDVAERVENEHDYDDDDFGGDDF
ncbi:hypothetical protein MRB53_030669 [Persea americana]|uniref:Uncharacterized protein n=1 Tax=Persea americana TaxID=3435 RepID=A0ACC2KLW4_PERAE|nr:hypothetical protein MRB53_030669 [Persea americana]